MFVYPVLSQHISARLGGIWAARHVRQRALDGPGRHPMRAGRSTAWRQAHGPQRGHNHKVHHSRQRALAGDLQGWNVCGRR